MDTRVPFSLASTRKPQVERLSKGTVWKALPQVSTGIICSFTWSQAAQLTTAHMLPPNTAKGRQLPFWAVPFTVVPVRSVRPLRACTW